jgi:RecA-family ATPase
MRKAILFVFLMSVLASGMAFGQEIYHWVDEKGTVHFSDDFTLIPEKYRDQIQKKESSDKPSSPPSTSPASARPTGETGAATRPEPATERKDLLGRGEDWWRAKVKEWNDKLAQAKKNYDLAYAAFKAKEKEYEDSRFKPDKFKRKLKKIEAEMNELESKAKDWEKQIEDAKNMLEKALPKEADDYRADPAWLKSQN